MSEILKKAIEGSRNSVEKVKEYKNDFENLDRTEIKEFSEFQKKYAQEADMETAMNRSLSSILEENKEKRETQEIKLDETNENNEAKEKLRELTGWPDEILDSCRSWEEAEIYRNANLRVGEINGKTDLIREDIDLDQEDEDGITNRERMERGRPPITKDGEGVELHHIGQKQDSPLAELTMEQHRGVGNDAILHDKTKETEIDRNEFSKERHEHWKDRLNTI